MKGKRGEGVCGEGGAVGCCGMKEVRMHMVGKREGKN